jgi:hypothetical protein
MRTARKISWNNYIVSKKLYHSMNSQFIYNIYAHHKHISRQQQQIRAMQQAFSA